MRADRARASARALFVQLGGTGLATKPACIAGVPISFPNFNPLMRRSRNEQTTRNLEGQEKRPRITQMRADNRIATLQPSANQTAPTKV